MTLATQRPKVQGFVYSVTFVDKFHPYFSFSCITKFFFSAKDLTEEEVQELAYSYAAFEINYDLHRWAQAHDVCDVRVNYKRDAKVSDKYEAVRLDKMIPGFDYDLFFSKTNSRYLLDSNGQRYGQFFMNEFRKICPTVEVPESCDCFYDDKKFREFLGFISTLNTSEEV